MTCGCLKRFVQSRTCRLNIISIFCYYYYYLHYYHYDNIILEPYTIRTAQLHLARLLELLRAPGPQDALREGRSPSVLETLTHTQTAGNHTYGALQQNSNTKIQSELMVT